MTETFNQPETIKVTCDAHSWMSAWIVVTNHPYINVSDRDGNFKITDVPAGTHTIEIWHETLGKSAQNTTMKTGRESKLTIEMSRKWLAE